MNQTSSDRILATPTAYAKEHYLYVQEVGTLKSLEPHISKREHLESYLFFAVLEGHGFVTIDHAKYKIQAGDCVWLDCRKPYSHESSAEEPWSLIWVHFNGSEAISYYKEYKEREGGNIFTPSSLSSYQELLQAIYQLQSGKSSLSDLLSHRYLTDLIASIFTNAFHGTAVSSIPDKLSDIHSYMTEHYSERLTLDILADHFFISKFHLVREYQRYYGTTIVGDLSLMRLAHAKSMLRFSKNSVEQIALACGFQTSAYFIKVFKKYENMTPLEYRRKW